MAATERRPLVLMLEKRADLYKRRDRTELGLAPHLWLNGLAKVKNHPDPDWDTGTSLDVDYMSVAPLFSFTSSVTYSFTAPVITCRLLPVAPRRAEL